MFDRLKALIGKQPVSRDKQRDRLSATEWPAAVYAIGDVHGRLDLLLALEQKIFADAAAIGGEKWIVMLGDYVDRGEQSAGVLDHLDDPLPENFQRICLAGNHEVMMLAFLAAPQPDSLWLRNGGDTTLQSYGIDMARLFDQPRPRRAAFLANLLPPSHLARLSDMPIMLTLPGVIFAHAGIRPGVAIEDQVEQDLLWIRDDFLEAERPSAPLVVHGHTPHPQPVIRPGRIGIDTGAFATGTLTAVKLDSIGTSSFLQANTEDLRLGDKDFP